MNSRVMVLHSGGEGDACECAFCVAGKLHADRHEVIVADFSRYLASHLLRERTLLVCLDGAKSAPSAEMLDFVDYLASLEAGSLDGLQYSVLCIERAARRGWHEFGRQIDGLFEGLGAQRLARRMDCPPHFQNNLHVWAETIATVLGLRREIAAAPSA